MEVSRPGRRRLVPLVLALIVLAVAAVTGAVVLTSGRDDRGQADGTRCLSTPVPSFGVPTQTDAAPGGGGLTVAEQGYGQIDEPGRNRAPGETVSLGAVVHNTSSRVAYRTRVILRVLDAREQSVVADRSGELLRQEIPVILPGQRVAVGAWTFVREVRAGLPATVAAVQVRLDTTHWLPADGFKQVTTVHRHTDRAAGEPASGSVDFAVTSPYCQPLAPRGVAAIFRDNAGTLIGGTFAYDNSRPRCQPGTHDEFISATRSIPLTADPTRTETATYCDVAPAPVATASDRPIN